MPQHGIDRNKNIIFFPPPPPQISNASDLLIAAQPGQQTFFLCVAPVQGLYLKCKEQTVSYTGAKSRSLPPFLCCGGQLHLWFYLTPSSSPDRARSVKNVVQQRQPALLCCLHCAAAHRISWESAEVALRTCQVLLGGAAAPGASQSKSGRDNAEVASGQGEEQ